jgi:GNAT superfamily N-acetyltransferase
MTLTIHTLCGPDAQPYLSDLAALRIAVFREYPYLYDGTLENEARYLRGYAKSDRGVIVIARDDSGSGSRVIGASTAMPMLEHGDGNDVAPALRAAGFDPSTIYYFGESVLLKEHRGRGIGHAFFDHREAQARKHGFGLAAFCAVQRPEGHPARPGDYVPHDPFWTKRGFVSRPDIVARMTWRDVGDDHETSKPLPFWIKHLNST